MALDKTEWTGINSGTDSGDSVEANLNTAFANTDIAIDQITANYSSILELQNREGFLFQDMTGNEPIHTAGQMYYANGEHNIQDGIADVTQQIGKELHIKGRNVSGATIGKGSIITYGGVTGGLPTAKLAMADSFLNARVTGVAAHNAPDNTVGLVTTIGEVSDIVWADVTETGITIANGDELFLSAIEAGKYTNVAPSIITYVGIALDISATEGKIFVKPNSNIVLPRTLGSLLGATQPTSIPLDLVNGTPISDYTSNIEIVTEANLVTGVITVPYDGTYRLNISLHMDFDGVGGAGKKEIYVDLHDTTDDVVVKSIKGFILKDAETYSVVDNGAVDLIANHEYRLELRSEISLSNFVFTTSTFYLESILY